MPKVQCHGTSHLHTFAIATKPIAHNKGVDSKPKKENKRHHYSLHRIVASAVIGFQYNCVGVSKTRTDDCPRTEYDPPMTIACGPGMLDYVRLTTNCRLQTTLEQVWLAADSRLRTKYHSPRTVACYCRRPSVASRHQFGCPRSRSSTCGATQTLDCRSHGPGFDSRRSSQCIPGFDCVFPVMITRELLRLIMASTCFGYLCVVCFGQCVLHVALARVYCLLVTLEPHTFP